MKMDDASVIERCLNSKKKPFGSWSKTIKNLPSATSENYADDVLAEIEYLKSRREITPKQTNIK